MARATNTELLARIAALEAQVVELRRPIVAASWRKNAAEVLVNGKARYTAFTHSEAFRCVSEAKAAGCRAMYRPLH